MNPTIIISTSINFLAAISNYLIAKKRAGEEPSATLPSLRDRAKMLISENGVIPLKER